MTYTCNRFFRLTLAVAALSAPAWVPPLAAPAVAADKADADEKTRQKWENIVQFYGEEETNMISLRVMDENVTEEGTFQFRELWKFDPTKVEWVKVDVAAAEVKVRLKRNKPQGSPPNSQVLADLPIKVQDVGLYFVRWKGDGVTGTTYTRLGTKALDRTMPKGPAKPGWRVEDVPLTPNKSELRYIPDPTYFTGPESTPLPKAEAPPAPAAPKKK